jgi:predicted Zn finger-like uncharacterized protein
MRIECPDCAAAYEVPEHRLTGRKLVRCARCGTEWTPQAPGPQQVIEEPHRLDLARVIDVLEAEPVETPPRQTRAGAKAPLERPSYSAMQRLARSAEPEPARSVWPWIAWAISLVVLAALVWGALVWRAEIMQVWPPSARLYDLLGLLQTTR